MAEDLTKQKIYQLLKHRDHPRLPLSVEKVTNGYVVGHQRQRYNSDELFIEECAKVQPVKSRKIWKLYWKRADLKWHGYGEYKTLESAIKEIDEDPPRLFFRVAFYQGYIFN